MASNGLRTTHLYAANGEIKEINIDRVMNLQYTFDDAGRISGIDVDGTLQQYQYNPYGLSMAESDGTVYRYEYDDMGNRRAQSIESSDGSVSATRYEYSDRGQGNRLLSETTLSGFSDSEEQPLLRHDSRLYSESGAAEQMNGFRYEYNSAQRPIKVFDNGKLLAEYAYNGFGERIKKVVHKYGQKRVTYYLYDGNTLTAEVDADTHTFKQAVFIDKLPVAYLVADSTFAIHSDHLGTPRMATDLNGERAWTADYDPFGKATVSATSTLVLPYRLPGQYADTETGTHYNYFRDYDPGTGRYITSDPIGLEGGLNTYAYALNDPLGLTDRLGLDNTGNASSTDDSPAKPTAADEQSYTDKLVKVLNYAIANLPAQADSAVKQVLENLKEQAVFMGVIIAAVAFNPAAAPIVLAGAWLLAGYSAAKFIYDAVGMLVELRHTDLCNDAALSDMGNRLAGSIGNLAAEIVSSALFGGITRLGGALRSAAEYAGQGAWRLWRSLRERFQNSPDTIVAGLCSFAGDTLVVTQAGKKRIKDIQAGRDRVWARDEHTGRTGWRSVLAHYSNRYEETVYVTASDVKGKRQTITSNRIHPYFARLAIGGLLATASIATSPAIATEGYVYSGEIDGGAWVDAQHLQVGDELLSTDNQWQTVEAVVIEDKPLDAFNLSVDEYATYFVAGDAGADAVWVHNSCADRIPDGYRWTRNHTDFDQPTFSDGNGNIWYRGHDGRYYDINDHPPTRNGIDGPSHPPTDYQTQFDGVRDVNDTTGQTLGARGSGTTLGANMEAVGITRPPNSDAHHIVASGSERAERARELIEEAGIDINEAANGVYLPSNAHYPDQVAPNHRRVHSNAYYQAIIDRLEGVGPSERRAEMTDIAYELANNLFIW